MLEYSNLAYYKFFYDIGALTEKEIHYAVEHAVLTRAEYKIITGKEYVSNY